MVSAAMYYVESFLASSNVVRWKVKKAKAAEKAWRELDAN